MAIILIAAALLALAGGAIGLVAWLLAEWKHPDYL
jgi:hypothetical protein